MPKRNDTKLYRKTYNQKVAEGLINGFDYPGDDCWAMAKVSGLMQYNAACRNPKAGTYGDVILFSYGDFNPVLITDAKTIATFGEIYKVPTTGIPNPAPGVLLNLLTNGSEGSFTCERDDYGTHWVHTVIIRIPQRSPSSKYFLDHIDHGCFSIVIANKDGGVLNTPDDDPGAKHYSQIFELYGENSGMVLSSISSSTALTNSNAYEITFNSDEKTGWEVGPPATLFNAADGDASKEYSYYQATAAALKSWAMGNSLMTSEELVDRLPEQQDEEA